MASALKREFVEETGLEVDPVRVLAGFDRERDKDRLVYLVFEVKLRKGDLKISAEHDKFGWFSKAEALRMLISPPLVKVLEDLD